MKDPFPIPPPEALVRYVQPLAEKLSLPSLGLHAHEVIFAFLLYTFVCSIVSPILSTAIWPDTYPKLNRRTKLNWDVHIVSFFQSVLISAFSLYVMYYDEERKELRDRDRWEARVWEYSGLSGLLQSFGLGYFLWDFFLCLWHVDIFGIGMLAHAISALTVFAFGYRPFIYFYAPVFLLYELSSPFLNIHWFCDKLDLTGSIYQAVNGVFLVGSFFGARLIFGNLSSFYVFSDIFRAVWQGRTSVTLTSTGVTRDWTVPELMEIYNDEQMQRMAFRGDQHIPLWLALIYLASNLVLNSLNIYWFGKMIQTIRKRFDPPFGTKGVGDDTIHYEPQEKVKMVAPVESSTTSLDPTKPKGSIKAARERAEAAINGSTTSTESVQVQRVVTSDGSKSVEVSSQRSLRTRRKA